MADIVDDFLSRLEQQRSALPTVFQSEIAQMEQRIRKQFGNRRVLIAVDPVELEIGSRQAWGGGKPYVAKQLNRTTRTTLLAQGLRQQRPLSEVFAQAGVSRTTGYRLLGRKTIS